MNKERREKFRRWFNSALLPCISVYGIVRYVGTVLHSDSLLESLMPKPFQKGTVVEDLKTYSTLKKTSWYSLKYKAHNHDMSKILWGKRFDKEYFVAKRNTYIEQGIPDAYSMEYLNIPIDETRAFFQRNDFAAFPEDFAKKSLTYYIAADLAIAESERADYSAFVVAGIDENKTMYIVDIIKARIDGRDIVDTILGLESSYRPAAFGIEEMQVSKAIGPFLREEMIKTGIFPNLVKLKHGGKDKTVRAKSMQARMRAHNVKFNQGADWYPDFLDECLTFPRGKHDDQVDAFAYLGMMLDIMVEAPTDEEQEEDEYEHELRSSRGALNGRNRRTGY